VLVSLAWAAELLPVDRRVERLRDERWRVFVEQAPDLA